MPPVKPENLFREFLRTFGRLKRAMEPYLSQFGISGAQWGTLRTLQRAKEEGLEGLRLKDLGQRLLIHPPSVTGVVDRLERMGLVARATSTDDLRAKQVRLTPAGIVMIERVQQGHAEQVRRIMGGLSAPEQSQLQVLLQRIGEHLDRMSQTERAT